jgi:hypothetical protein
LSWGKLIIHEVGDARAFDWRIGLDLEGEWENHKIGRLFASQQIYGFYTLTQICTLKKLFKSKFSEF